MLHRAWARHVLHLAGLSCALGFAGSALAAGASTPTVGSPDVAIADPGVPRPAGTPCVVQLFSDVSYTDFSNHTFAYAPPAGCQGSWSKVVLEADFSVTAGRQFDRTANIWIGGVNVYFGTTQEPSATVAPSWHIERDLTDYTALLKSAQQGQSLIGNIVDGTYTGVIHGTARLLFYPGKPASTAPDAVYPLGSDPIGSTTSLNTPSDSLSRTFTLPRNVEKAYLDVFAQSQIGDEFWYTCVPDQYASQVQECGGGNFRETEVSIDGQPAGVAPIYPWVYTGGIDPYMWRPTTGVQTLNFLPYRVDLSPFAGVLSDGQPHTVAVSVAGANNYFSATAALLVYQDAHSKQVTGKVTRNTLIGQAVTPTVTDSLQNDGNGNISGPINTTISRQFVIEGYTNTSKGRVQNTVTQTVGFDNTQTFTINATQYRQVTSQTTTVNSISQSKIGPLITAEYRETTSYPFYLDYNQTANDDGSTNVASAVKQGYQKHLAHRLLGIDLFTADVANAISTGDTLVFDSTGVLTSHTGQQSTQDFNYTDSLLGCYKTSLTTSAGVLTSYSQGKGCLGGRNRVAWFTHPDGSPDGGNASTLW
ncbi:peptide-N4-asparagine amidase [Dyella sp.]|uniref:peptide-N4-asparagine amidase n=1 Tax=Dyella sp. TaxID=1869338 RepID=UPI002ED54FC5